MFDPFPSPNISRPSLAPEFLLQANTSEVAEVHQPIPVEEVLELRIFLGLASKHGILFLEFLKQFNIVDTPKAPVALLLSSANVQVHLSCSSAFSLSGMFALCFESLLESIVHKVHPRPCKPNKNNTTHDDTQCLCDGQSLTFVYWSLP